MQGTGLHMPMVSAPRAAHAAASANVARAVVMTVTISPCRSSGCGAFGCGPVHNSEGVLALWLFMLPESTETNTTSFISLVRLSH
ncbi:hypothetical protein DTO166G4_9091 [Paecilomyces variotii]|nr:hypothetical protein DTO166G4_9091 [Paecilomyces variotii]KAJ9229186.1 hypothetical protein DTO166G5_8037 [Paecilomyces variotii]KAJ9316012.1 hypothetical protein DTO271D3_3588 [Paecilomyces variotii]